MKPADLDQIASRFSHIGALPLMPLISSGEEKRPYVEASLIVDLMSSVKKASEMKAPSLSIYCDTLTIGKDQKIRIDQSPLRVSIITRRIVAQEGAKIVLNHFETDDRTAVRIICSRLEGPLEIISDTSSGHEKYDLETLNEAHEVPHFTNFVYLDGAAVTRTSVMPTGILANGEPLHKTLKAQFALVAALLAENDTSQENADLARDLLNWLAGWSGLQDDIAQIARLSERLKGLVPQWVVPEKSVSQDTKPYMVLPIPQRTSADYLLLAGTRQKLARSIEVDEKFIKQTGTIQEVAGEFATAMAKRDAIEVGQITQEIQILQAQTPRLEESLTTAAKAMQDQNFQQKLDRIDLDLAIELDKIDKIVKASFEIVVGLATLGASIAAICMGVPADPSASAKKDIEGVQGLASALKEGWTTKDDLFFGGGIRHLLNLIHLYQIPFSFIWKNKSAMKDSFKALAASGLAIAKAGSTINSAGSLHGKVDDIIEVLNIALRDLAKKPSLIEARAAWDAMEVNVVNQLQRTINDSETASGIKDAAAKYMTTMQKIAIYGRALAEHQAAIDANQRDIAARLLQRCTQIKKQAVMGDLQVTFGDRKELNAHMQAELDDQLDAAERSFFVACYGYRRAQYYETYSYPATPITLSHGSSNMSKSLSDLSTDKSDANRIVAKRATDIRTEIILDDTEALAKLVTGNGTDWVIKPSDVLQTGYVRMRLHKVSLHLETEQDVSGEIGFEMGSTSSFEDLTDHGSCQFIGSAVSVPYVYDAQGPSIHRDFSGVLPTPFSEWFIRMTHGAGRNDVKALKLTLEGKAFA